MKIHSEKLRKKIKTNLKCHYYDEWKQFHQRLLSFPFRHSNKFPKCTTKKFPNHKSRLTNYTPTVTEKRWQKKCADGEQRRALEGHWVLIAALMGVVRAKMRAGVHLTVICNKIRWLLMTPTGSVMAGIKALIPARTSAAHGSTQAKPATDGLTTGLHGGHPGSR